VYLRHVGRPGLIARVKKRITITVNVNPALAERFREFVDAYNGKMGMCISAAMLCYLRATEKARSELHREIFESQFGDAMEALLEEIRPPSPGAEAKKARRRE
jgi:hypothetical protein